MMGPVVGTEYTVSGFLGVKTHFGVLPGVTLKEVATPACECCGEPLAWPIAAFRPIVGKETEAEKRIEQLRDLARRASDAAKAPVKVPAAEPADASESARGICAGPVDRADGPSELILRGAALLRAMHARWPRMGRGS